MGDRVSPDAPREESEDLKEFRENLILASAESLTRGSALDELVARTFVRGEGPIEWARQVYVQLIEDVGREWNNEAFKDFSGELDNLTSI